MNEVQDSDFRFREIEAGHMWTEPKNDQASALYLDANFEKAFKIDDISSVFHYELIGDKGGLNFCMTAEGKGESRSGDFDGMLHEDEIVSLLPAFSLSKASEDYLDMDTTKRVPDLDYQFCEELSNEAVELSESPIPLPKCDTGQFAKTTDCGKRDVSGNKWESERPIEDNFRSKCPFSCDLHVNEANDVQSLLESGSYLNCNEKKTELESDTYLNCNEKKTDFLQPSVTASCNSAHVQYDEVDPMTEGIEAEDFSTDDMSTDSSSDLKIGLARQRRLCKPPQRYVEGATWLISRIHRTRKCSTSSSKDKDLGVRSQKHKTKASKRKASKILGSKLMQAADGADQQ